MKFLLVLLSFCTHLLASDEQPTPQQRNLIQRQYDSFIELPLQEKTAVVCMTLVTRAMACRALMCALYPGEPHYFLQLGKSSATACFVGMMTVFTESKFEKKGELLSKVAAGICVISLLWHWDTCLGEQYDVFVTPIKWFYSLLTLGIYECFFEAGV